jgi:PAS domain S-box-containing protein
LSHLDRKSVIRVLYVDDDPSIIEVSKQILIDIDARFEINDVCCVDEAFKKLETGQYDVVVSDYELPLKNGLEFLRELRERHREIPFILFTGRGREEVAIEALNLGADSYISKIGSPKTVFCELADAINKAVQHKKSRELLAGSEAKYRTLVEKSLQGILVTKVAPLRLVFANNAIEKILGYSLHELMSLSPQGIMGLIYPEDRAIFFKRMESRLQGEQPETFHEFRAVRKDGSIIWMNALANRIEFEGQPAVQGVFLDIDERKKLEATVKEKLDMLEALTQNIGAGFVTISKDYRVMYANKFVKNNIGNVEGKLCYATLNTLDHICPDCGVKKVFEEGVAKDSHEYSQIGIDGKQFFVDIIATPLKDKDGNVTAALEFIVDIGEKKRLQQKLQTNEAKFRAISDSAIDAIFMFDEEDKITYWNPAAERIFGFTEKEAVGEKVNATLVPSRFREGHLKLTSELGKVKNKKNAGEIREVPALRKDGAEFSMELSMAPLQLENKGYFVAIARDVTERKKAEEHRKVLERKVNDYSKHLKCMVDLRTVQLKDSNERLVRSERLAAIGELAGMVGHDLRNPLAGIKNAAYFLKKKGTEISEAQNKEMLEIIDKAIDHSDKIINDLLDYAREMHLELTKYAAHTLVDEAIRLIKIPDRIQIINNVPDTIWIRVNTDKMMRVFINLIKNAIDAMPEKGTLTITSCQTRDYLKIAFADTGNGIPEEILQKLFTPLFTTKAQGMGFGLAICKRIIEAHEGNINVKTTVNKGTTFTITLPNKPNANVECEKKLHSPIGV